MEKRNKMKFIVILVVTIILGMFVISVTAQTISQYRQRCHDLDTSQDGEDTSPYTSQGCHEQQNRSCCNSLPLRDCC